MSSELVIAIESVQNILLSRATGKEGPEDEHVYRALRHQLLATPEIVPLLPRFISTCRDLSQFWNYVKAKFGTYQERREYIWGEFAPLLAKLEGFPPISVPSPVPQPTKLKAKTKVTIKHRYDVALSFAGEDRAYVEEVAEQLRHLEVTVFYDRFEEVGLWGTELTEHFGWIYGGAARFVVLFLSRAYAAKAWPRHEKQFALGKQIATGEARILPVRFDDTEIPGLPPTLGYLDLRQLTPTRLAELIRQKVSQAEAKRDRL
ncbi:MAG TPA: TIR domain-containing protein [Longimicrobium sp.]|jgi:hypothetical protein